jgi:hypothetical protein
MVIDLDERNGQSQRLSMDPHVTAPVGYLAEKPGYVKDPDQRIQQAVRQVFDKFLELGTVRQVLFWHVEHEIGHVRWDDALLDWVWPKTNPLLRRLNVHFLAWMINEYFTTPKRTAVRVVAALVREFPSLRPQYPEFCRQLRALKNDTVYRRSLYCADNVPMKFKRFDAGLEVKSLVKAMPGYAPGTH